MASHLFYSINLLVSISALPLGHLIYRVCRTDLNVRNPVARVPNSRSVALYCALDQNPKIPLLTFAKFEGMRLEPFQIGTR